MDRLDGKIAIADGIHRVLGDFRPAFVVHKAEQIGNKLAPERKRGTGECAAAERTDIDPRETLAEAFVIAGEHLHVGEQVMREIDRLSAL